MRERERESSSKTETSEGVIRSERKREKPKAWKECEWDIKREKQRKTWNREKEKLDDTQRLWKEWEREVWWERQI